MDEQLLTMLTQQNDLLGGIYVALLTIIGVGAAVGVLVLLYKFLRLFFQEVKMLEGFAITAELVQPVTDALSSGLSTLVPIGIGIMATFVGISLIPVSFTSSSNPSQEWVNPTPVFL